MSEVPEKVMLYRTGDMRRVDKVLQVQHGILRRIVAACRDYRILC
ncbi:hypothetical protein [Stenotrophomonas pavanii]|nr:hypothetical protein [Stenotrophomonas pavanii]